MDYIQNNIEKKQKKKKNNKHKLGPDVVLENLPLFKQAEKKYRYYKGLKTDFSNVWYEKDLVKYCNLLNVDGKIVYYLKKPEGVYIIKNFLDLNEQILFSRKLLNEYHKSPYKTNVDSLELIKQNDKSLFIKDMNKYCFNNKIRWSNMGFQYNWGERSYPDTKTIIQSELNEICEKTKKSFLGVINNIENYEPQSVIINYYGEKDYMGGHLDDGEKDQDSPIISYSIGLTCVFLIGGISKEVEPVALALESGDLLIMSGYSRKCYHGVPRIIENSFNSEEAKKKFLNSSKPKIEEDGTFQNNEIHTLNYLEDHRLNFNFRKVINY